MSSYIEVKNVSKSFGGKAILQDVSLSIEQGTAVGLVGANGSGKSVLFKILCGFEKPDRGSVYVRGKQLGKNGRDFPESLGVFINSPGFIGIYSGFQNLKFLADIQGKIGEKEIRQTMTKVGLDPDNKAKVDNYSLGMKQRLGIANAILHDPELLILDEPTNGLDPIGIAEMRNFIKELSVERGKTILISSHILSEIALLADDIGIIDHGLLLEENSMKELKKKNRKYILLQVSDVSKAALILEHQFHLVDYSVHDDQTLRIYDTCLDMAEINKALIVQDIAVISSQVCNDTLEDYFKKITGGEGIA